MLKACINLLSSRKKCLPRFLQSLFTYYNYKHNYPVYVYYFDTVYEDVDFRKRVWDTISKNIYFRRIDYNTPKHISKKELFYNRTNLWYVKKAFSIARKGYLHMCHFIVNCYNYPNTEFKNYDYIAFYDDESGYIKELPYDPFEFMSKRTESMGALIVGQRLKNGKPHQGHLDTRINLWQFTKNFLLVNNITPKSRLLQNLLEDNKAEENFHFLPWADSYIMKTSMFRSILWKKWVAAINSAGGIYKYRWGDNELYSLFYLIYDNKPIYNLKVVEKGYHNQGLYRHLHDIAPSIKDNKK